MANIRTSTRSFNGGEVTSEFFGRIDDAKYQTGLALCRNFIVLPHGPIANRPGFEFVRAVKHPDRATRLLNFTFSVEQTMVIEFGHQYFRFHTMGGTVLNGTTPYELAHPYTEEQLFEVQYVQSIDVVTLVHPEHPPRELRRLGATNWTLTTISFAAALAPPSSVSATPAGSPSDPRTYTYGVTAVAGVEESVISVTDNASTNLDEAGTSVTVTWAARAGAEFYRVYRKESGVMAYIGLTEDTSFLDEGIMPDVSITPPKAQNPFVGAGNYPAAVTYFEQRRVFAATLNNPQTIWMTRSGTEKNLNTSLPVRDDDAVSFRIAAREANRIQHLVPLQDMVVLTQAAEWRLAEDITPASINIKPQSFIGASSVPPLVTNTSLVFPAARGGHVRELGYSQDAGGYITNDLSLRSVHLFDGFQLVDSALSRAPWPCCWFVSSSGKLLGCTYLPEQNIGAWHQHTTDGAFESITVVAEGDEDVLYAVIRREINGVTTRYVERHASRLFDDAADCFFVDAGARYDGPPISSVSSGLAHLEGKEVAILADGAVLPRQTVQGGSVSLGGRSASKIAVGLPIDAAAQTLPFAVEMQGYGQGRPKSVLEVWLRVAESRGAWVGPRPDKLTEIKPRTDEEMGSPPDLQTAELDIKITPTWGRDGELYIAQPDPLPLTVLAITMELSVGG